MQDGDGEPRASTPAALSPVVAAVLTFIATASVLVLEIAAGRLLAPYVGVSLTTYTGIIGAILAGIALGAWLGGKAADVVGPLPLLGPAFILGGLSAIPMAAALDGFLWPVFPMTVAVKAAAIMLLINAAMMLIFVWVVRSIGPVFASQTANVIVLAGVFWGWFIFDEILSPWVWAAIVVTAAGVALVTLRPTVPVQK